MVLRKTADFCSNDDFRASTLLSALLLLNFVSVLFLFILSDYHEIADFSIRTQKYYELKSMKDLFLADYYALPTNQRLDKGRVNYNIGFIEYELREKQLLKITAVEQRGKWDQKKIHFSERLLPEFSDPINKSME